ncbi:MAG: DNA adenine methylase [Polaribacter sp.]|uniref:DNA adenine methylase n=1 Tax=Polaribacter sp. TaxID=1920175 RepID=UPI002F35D610
MKSKFYNTAPLPFVGQKRNFIKHFKEELHSKVAPPLYVDLFGGSGLLSRAAKDVHPTAKVVYNDFDNYRKRLKTISKTNKILQDLRVLVDGIERKKIVPKEIKEKIINRIKQESGFIDFITLSSSLLFSMKYVSSIQELEKETLYNKVKINNYPTAKDYLDDIEVVSTDYKKVFEKYKDVENVVFLIDPPYLSTDCSTYSSDGYWKLKDYLDVLKTLQNQNYFYFTSNKSSIIELCEWISDYTGGLNPFENAAKKEYKASMNHNATYTDIMLFKWTQTTTY